VIAGYFGSGAQGHPNQGYLLDPPYSSGSFVPENFPGSVQTQVTGLNDRGVTVGLKLSRSGQLAGVPLEARVYRFTVRVRDHTHPRMTATRALKLVVHRR
jgi:hypothetical protein